MSAGLTDKLTDTRNAARPNSARVTSGRSAGGATLACDNLSGWPTASKVHFVTYKIDSNSAVVAGSQLDCYGIVSGNNIGSFTVVDGTDTGHAVGDVVEMLPTAAWGQDLADALSVGHTRTGAHVANLPLTTPVLTTPTVADFTGASHTHANAAGGGQLGFSALLSTIFSGQLSSYTQSGTGGGTGYYINLGGIKLCWGRTGSLGPASGFTAVTIGLPTSFYTTVVSAQIFVSSLGTDQAQGITGNVVPTTSTLSLYWKAGTNGTATLDWFVIGT